MIGLALPLRPYRCYACSRRFWGLARPVFTWPRALIGGLFALTLLFSAADFWFQSIYMDLEDPLADNAANSGWESENPTIPGERPKSSDATANVAARTKAGSVPPTVGAPSPKESDKIGTLYELGDFTLISGEGDGAILTIPAQGPIRIKNAAFLESPPGRFAVDLAGAWRYPVAWRDRPGLPEGGGAAIDHPAIHRLRATRRNGYTRLVIDTRGRPGYQGHAEAKGQSLTIVFERR